MLTIHKIIKPTIVLNKIFASGTIYLNYNWIENDTNHEIIAPSQLKNNNYYMHLYDGKVNLNYKVFCLKNNFISYLENKVSKYTPPSYKPSLERFINIYNPNYQFLRISEKIANKYLEEYADKSFNRYIPIKEFIRTYS